MEINVTLFLQALQFACVYYFLYVNLFIPAYTILDENERLKHELYKNLEREQHIKDALLRDYNTKNSNFKRILLQEIPEQATESSCSEGLSFTSIYDGQAQQLSEQDKEEIECFLVDRLSQVIKK